MPMRVIAKKRCRAMVEPPEKGERATLNLNLSTRLKPTFFSIGTLGGRLVILVEEESGVVSPLFEAAERQGKCAGDEIGKRAGDLQDIRDDECIAVRDVVGITGLSEPRRSNPSIGISDRSTCCYSEFAIGQDEFVE
jgi:hypothetical protein